MQYLLTSQFGGNTLVPSQTHQNVILSKIKKRQNLPNIMMFFSIARSIVWVIIVKVSGEDQQRVIYLQTNPHIHKLIVTSTTTTSEKVKDIFSKKCSFWWGRKIRHDMLFVIVKYLYCAWLDLLRWRFFGRKKLTRNEKKVET